MERKTYLPDSDIELIESQDLVTFPTALAYMEKRVDSIYQGTDREAIWFLEHPPLLTAGTSAIAADLLDGDTLPVFKVGRGGQYTYHGPGQRVAYLMLDLRKRGQDVRAYISSLESWLMAALGEFNVKSFTTPNRVGLWVDRSSDKGTGHEDKIAAIGIRLRRWISFYGVAINVEPDLSQFNKIIPCGIHEPLFGVTSLVDLGLPIDMRDLDLALIKHLNYLRHSS